MRIFRWLLGLLLAGLLALVVSGGAQMMGALPSTASDVPHPVGQAAPFAGGYALLAWNDLGMHCYNRDFRDLAVLPPYNTLWAQVVKVDDPPQLVVNNVRVEYSFPDNTYSVNGPGGVNKTDFWQYAPQLFGTTLASNVGLAGKGLAGVMDPKGDHFEAVGIPLTEFSDSAVALNPNNPALWPPQPYQLAHIVARDATTGAILAENTVVAPVSTEMHCDTCHSDGQQDAATGRVETNILTLHDQEEGTHLMSARPVLCAGCHGSNALGTPVKPDIPSLSNAMHRRHASNEVNLPPGTAACYACHPGPQTQCLRDTMAQNLGFTCQTCHGQLTQVALNPNPWLNEPRCHNSGCHGPTYFQNQALYRMSTGNGGIRCEGCHDSTHAIAQSREANDADKFINLQGYAGTLNKCTVCHLSPMTGPVHVPLQTRAWLPSLAR